MPGQHYVRKDGVMSGTVVPNISIRWSWCRSCRCPVTQCSLEAIVFHAVNLCLQPSYVPSLDAQAIVTHVPERPSPVQTSGSTYTPTRRLERHKQACHPPAAAAA